VHTTLITHAAHAPWLRQLLQCADALAGRSGTHTKPQLLFVSSPPGGQWQGAPAATDEVR
jgi:hypothetical protein